MSLPTVTAGTLASRVTISARVDALVPRYARRAPRASGRLNAGGKPECAGSVTCVMLGTSTADGNAYTTRYESPRPRDVFRIETEPATDSS